MKRTSGLLPSAALGVFVLLCVPLRAQAPDGSAPQAAEPLALVASGSIAGVVQDEAGAAVAGASISAVGTISASAVTDRNGRFVLQTLPPGPYVIRAQQSGFVSSRGQLVQVRASGRASSSIAIHRVKAPERQVLEAGVGAGPVEVPEPAPVSTGDESSRGVASSEPENQGETAWRLRHARRGVLKDVTLPESVIADDGRRSDGGLFAPLDAFLRSGGARAAQVSSFLSDVPFSGQLKLLTTGSLENAQDMFTRDVLGRSVAYITVGAPVGDHADWNVRGALTQGDVASWIVAGSYVTRGPARHSYNVGLSYATERFDGGNAVALRDLAAKDRNAGSIYAFDAIAVAPGVDLNVGSRYARYDYLAGRSLVSPRVALTLTPDDEVRINLIASHRAIAPGAEEFLPPGDSEIWLPPQRTFSSLVPGEPLRAERTNHFEIEVEKDLAGSTMSLRAFRQMVGNQLVTMFVQVPNREAITLGHYFVTSGGNVDAAGVAAGWRTAIAGRVHGSVEYSMSQARWDPKEDIGYLVVLTPSAARVESERIHDVATALETDVRETSTRVTVLYRLSNGFAHHQTGSTETSRADRPQLDSRFEVQVHQSLPFMDFTNAKWEMLFGVRNFFREAASDQSIYDELLVVSPPKRIVGGLTLRF